MDDDLKRLLETMRQENTAAHAETRRHFDVVAEQLDSKIQLVAEGVVGNSERIDRLDTKVDRLATDIKSDFSDVRSMIKFSHAELDRRIRTLEEGFADLQARVERLETSTH